MWKIKFRLDERKHTYVVRTSELRLPCSGFWSEVKEYKKTKGWKKKLKIIEQISVLRNNYSLDKHFMGESQSLLELVKEEGDFFTEILSFEK